jgi:hypothetical protein
VETPRPHRAPPFVVQVRGTAVAGRADLTVSGARTHLVPLSSSQGIDIVDAVAAVKRIASG